MKLRLVTITLAVLLCALSCPTSYAQTGTKGDPLDALAQKLVERLVAKERTKVTILDFTDIQGRPNILGRYLAERLDVRLANIDGITVVDRRNIARIMQEHKLTEDGLINPENAKKLGQFAGVEVILIGSLAIAEENVELLAKAVSTETSEILAAGETRLPLTPDFRQWLGQSVASGSQGSVSRSPGASSAEGDAIATREVGPITVVLRNAQAYTVKTSRGAVPTIRCTFDLENRNLQRSVAVAANQHTERSHGFDDVRYRGGLVDSNRLSWTLEEVNGISAILGFDYTTRSIRKFQQVNPGGIIDYIRRGRECDGEGSFSRSSASGRYWFGSFSPIPPGETIRMTIDFVPEGTDQRSPPEIPDYFQLDMELVLATFAEGEEPAKAKDLMLRNLTIDRIVLPE